MQTDSLSELRPLAMGELIDRSARLWRAQLKPLFQIFLGFELLVYAAIKGYRVAIRIWFPLVEGGMRLADAIQNDSREVARQFILAGLAGLPVLVLYLIIAWLAAIAGARFVLREYLGEPSSPPECIRFVVGHLGRAMRVLLLCLLIGLAMGFAFMAPGALLAILGTIGTAASSRTSAVVLLLLLGMLLAMGGAFLCFLWYLLRFLLIAPVVAAEELGAIQALKRSRELISGSIGPGVMNRVRIRAAVLLAVLGMVLIVVTSIGSVPAVVVTLAYTAPWDPARSDPTAVPQLLLVPAELFQIGVQALFSPLYVIFASLFYVDMRVRREGLDLQLKLDRTYPRAA